MLISMLIAGEDGVLKFWDVRQTDAPLKVVPSHGHWVSSVRHNTIYDQAPMTVTATRTLIVESVYHTHS